MNPALFATRTRVTPAAWFSQMAPATVASRPGRSRLRRAAPQPHLYPADAAGYRRDRNAGDHVAHLDELRAVAGLCADLRRWRHGRRRAAGDVPQPGRHRRSAPGRRRSLCRRRRGIHAIDGERGPRSNRHCRNAERRSAGPCRSARRRHPTASIDRGRATARTPSAGAGHAVHRLSPRFVAWLGVRPLSPDGQRLSCT